MTTSEVREGKPATIEQWDNAQYEASIREESEVIAQQEAEDRRRDRESFAKSREEAIDDFLADGHDRDRDDKAEESATPRFEPDRIDENLPNWDSRNPDEQHDSREE
jgi:hypothetical protein